MMKNLSFLLLLICVCGSFQQAVAQWTLQGVGGRSYTITPTPIKRSSSSTPARTANSSNVYINVTYPNRTYYSSSSYSGTSSSSSSGSDVGAAIGAALGQGIVNLISNARHERQMEAMRQRQMEMNYQREMEERRKEEERVRHEILVADAAVVYSSFKGIENEKKQNNSQNSLGLRTEAALQSDIIENSPTTQKYFAETQGSISFEKITEGLATTYNYSTQALQWSKEVVDTPVYQEFFEVLKNNTGNVGKYLQFTEDGIKLTSGFLRGDQGQIKSVVWSNAKKILNNITDNHFINHPNIPFRSFYNTVKSHLTIKGLYETYVTNLTNNIFGEMKNTVNRNYTYQPTTMLPRMAQETSRFSFRSSKAYMNL